MTVCERCGHNATDLVNGECLRCRWEDGPPPRREPSLETVGERREFDSSPRDRGWTNESEPLPFRTAADLRAEAPPEVSWVLPYVPRGAVTLVAGAPKVGKSTFLLAVASAVESGVLFLGERCEAGPVLYLTEEPPSTFEPKLDRFGLGERVHVLYRHEVWGQPWADLMSRATEQAVQAGAILFIVDTFAAWSCLRGDAENAAGSVLEALEPVQTAAAQGLGVVLAHHHRKAPGEYGEAVRGSSAITGAVDIVVEIDRPRGTDALAAEGNRIIRAVGRLEVPPAVAVRLDGDRFLPLGEAGIAKTEAEREKVLAAVKELDNRVTGEEVAKTVGLSKGTALRHLKALAESGDLQQAGEGKKGDPFKFWIHSSSPESLRDESNPQVSML